MLKKDINETSKDEKHNIWNLNWKIGWDYRVDRWEDSQRTWRQQ